MHLEHINILLNSAVGSTEEGLKGIHSTGWLAHTQNGAFVRASGRKRDGSVFDAPRVQANYYYYCQLDCLADCLPAYLSVCSFGEGRINWLTFGLTACCLKTTCLRRSSLNLQT